MLEAAASVMQATPARVALTAIWLCLWSLSACSFFTDFDDFSVADAAVTDATGEASNPMDYDTVYAVRDESFPVGEAVRFEGVVVVAVDRYGTLANRVFVQAPAGGAFGSVAVVADASTIADLAPGDVVTITGGIKDEFAAAFDTSGRTQTRIVAAPGGAVSITRTGTTTAPTPTLVDPFVIAASTTEAEKWESSLVRVENVRTRDVPTVPGSDPSLKNATLTGQLRASSNLTEFGSGGVDFAVGTCFASITGILEYFGFVSNLMPRDASDFTSGSACPTDTNIVGIQDTTVPTSTTVALTDVIITALDPDPENPRVWVADAAQAAVNSGILVYDPTISLGTIADLEVGDVVRVVGTTTEFMSLTELVSARIVPVTFLANTPPVPLSVSVDTVDGNPEPYEGVLVSFSAPVTVTAIVDFGDYTVGTSAAYRVDESIFDSRPARTVGECLETVRGVVGFVGGNANISPRDAGDIVSGGTCL